MVPESIGIGKRKSLGVGRSDTDLFDSQCQSSDKHADCDSNLPDNGISCGCHYKPIPSNDFGVVMK